MPGELHYALSILLVVTLHLPGLLGGGTIGTGEVHTCIVVDNRAKCFGDGFDGRTGYGDQESRGDTTGSMALLDYVDVDDVEAIELGAHQTCFIRAGRLFRCVGYGGDGVLGQGNPNSTPTTKAGSVPDLIYTGDPLEGVRALKLGTRHICGVFKNDLKCWGSGLNGRHGTTGYMKLGDDAGDGITGGAFNVPFAFSDKAVQVAPGDLHTCVLLTSRRVVCFGAGLLGRLGSNDQTETGGAIPTTTAATSPLAFNPTTNQDIVQVAAGQHTCALFANWQVRCWGPNELGELGIGQTQAAVPAMGDDANEMTTLPFLDFDGVKVTYIDVGFRTTCVIFQNKKVRCFGDNTHGQLGQGHTNPIGDQAGELSTTPDIVFDEPTRGVLQVSVGKHHACAVFDGSEVPRTPRYKCWGYSLFGQTGADSPYSIGDQPNEMSMIPYISLPTATRMNIFRVFPGQGRPGAAGLTITVRGPFHSMWKDGATIATLGVISTIKLVSGAMTWQANGPMIDAETITVALPPIVDPGAGMYQDYRVTVSFDSGTTFHETDAYFRVQSLPFDKIVPAGGIKAGGTKIVALSTAELDPRDQYTCKYINNVGSPVTTRALLDANNKKQINCMDTTPFQSTTTPKFFGVDFGFGYSETSGIIFHYYDIGVTSITPTFGPASGGDNVRILVSSYQNTNSPIKVKFNVGALDIITNGTYDNGNITCLTPDVRVISAGKFLLPVDMKVYVSLDGGQGWSSTFATFQYHTPLLIETVSPPTMAFGSPSSEVTIKGLNFFDTGPATTKAEITVGTQVRHVPLTLQVKVNGTNDTYTFNTPTDFAQGGIGTVEVTVNGERFTQSRFKFSYYQFIDFVPKGGISTGGTPVTISGRGFFGNNVECEFGSYNGTANIVKALVLDSNNILCKAPALRHGYNGTNFTTTLRVNQFNRTWIQHPVEYLYYDHPVVTALFPVSGPPTNSTVVTLYGSGFLSIGGGTIPTCRVRQAVVNMTIDPTDQTSATCKLPPGVGIADVEVSLNSEEYVNSGQKFSYYALYAILPASSPTAGGTSILISGANLPTTNSMVCRFNKTEVAAKSISSAQVECLTPSTPFAGNITIGFSADGKVFTETLPPFLYYATPSVTAVDPKTGSGAGGTPVTVYGSNFIDIGSQIKCKFGLAASNGQLVGNHIECPAAPGLGEVVLEISLNDGQSWTVSKQPFVFASVLNIIPPYGDIAGGTTVTVTGGGFYKEFESQTHCAIGASVNLPAVRVDERHVLCVVPKRTAVERARVDVHTNGLDFQDTGIRFTYYDSPKINEFSPTHGPTDAQTTVVILGERMPENADLVCRFGSAFSENPKRTGSVRVDCPVPKNSPGPVDLSISFNSVDFIKVGTFTYYNIFALNPPRGPSEGGTNIDIAVSGFKGANFWDIQCNIGGLPIVGEYVSDKLVRCIAPPADSAGVDFKNRTSKTVPRLLQQQGDEVASTAEISALVTVTANGLDFIGDTLFHYYEDPTVTAFYPPNSTSAGGQYITLFGSSFTKASTLSCKWGEPYDFPVVSGTFVSDTQIVCRTVAHEPKVVRPFVSNNGQQFHQSSELVNFTFTSCPPGSYSSSFSEPCIPCPVGTSNPKLGALQCGKCNTTSYMPDLGAVECIACPENTFIPDLIRTDISQCTCIGGAYHPDQRTGEACEPCPPGGSCRGTSFLPEPDVGFWNREANRLVFIECASEFACPGGQTESCGVGYAGRMCGMCEKGYYKAGLLCPACPNNPRFILYAFFLFMALFSGFILLFTGKRATVFMSNVTIVAYYTQILGILAKLRMNWPWQIALAMKIISAPFRFDMDILATECSLPISRKWAYQLKWIALMCIPFLVPFFYAIYYVAAKIRFKVVGEVKPEGVLRDTDWQSPLEKVESFSRSLLGSYIFFLSLTYLILVQAAMELFDCTKSADGGWTLDAQPDLQCYQTWWWAIVPAAITALVLYGIALPVTIIYIGWRGRHHLTHPIIVELSSAMTVEFKHTHYYWKSFLLIEQFLCAAALTFFTVHRQMQLLSFLMILFVSLAMHMKEKPYFVNRYNTYQTICRFSAICVLMGGLLFLDNTFPVPGSRAFTLIWVITFIGVGISTSIYYFSSDMILWYQGTRHLESTTPELIRKLCHPQGRSVITRFLAWGRQIDLDPDPFNYMFQALAYEFNDKRRPDRETLELAPDNSSVHAMIYAFTGEIFWEPVIPAVQHWILNKIRRSRRGDPIAVVDIDRFHALFTQLSRFKRYGFFDPEKEKLKEQAEKARQGKLRRRRKAREAYKARYGDDMGEAELALAEAAADMTGAGDEATAALLGLENLGDLEKIKNADLDAGKEGGRRGAVIVPDDDEEGVEPDMDGSGSGQEEGVEPDVESSDEEGIEPDVVGGDSRPDHSDDSDEEPYWESILSAMNPWYVKKPKVEAIGYAKAVARDQLLDANGEQLLVKLLPVKRKSAEYQDIKNWIATTIVSHNDKPLSRFDLIKIESVVNESLWSQYSLTRRNVNLKLRATKEKVKPIPCNQDLLLSSVINEYYLWHGCNEALIEKITTFGFEPNLSSMKGMFGAGTYFAEHFSKSDLYTHAANCGQVGAVYGKKSNECTCQYDDAPQYKMLLCRVTMGDTYRTNEMLQGIRIPPEKPGSIQHYDSVFAQNSNENKVADYTLKYNEFITFEKAKAYPAYVITYRRHHDASAFEDAEL